MQVKDFELPEDAPVLCISSRYDPLIKFAFAGREVTMIKVHRQQRRVDLRWGDKTDPPIWREMPSTIQRLIRRNLMEFAGSFRRNVEPLMIGAGNLEVSGLGDEIGVQASGVLHLMPASSLAKYLLHWLDRFHERPTAEMSAVCTGLFTLVYVLLMRGRSQRIPDMDDNVLEYLHRFSLSREGTISRQQLSAVIDLDELVSLIKNTTWKVFNPAAWKRDAE